MKRYIITSVFLFFSILVFAQDVTLTKGETVAWLDKKIKEIVGHSFYAKGTPKVSDAGVKFVDGLLIISIAEDYGKDGIWIRTSKFNPMYMNYVGYKGYFSGGSIDKMKITFPTKSVIGETITPSGKTDIEEADNYDYSFLRADETAPIKIRKALLHLQALLKAEDDPFGN